MSIRKLLSAAALMVASVIAWEGLGRALDYIEDRIEQPDIDL